MSWEAFYIITTQQLILPSHLMIKALLTSYILHAHKWPLATYNQDLGSYRYIVHFMPQCDMCFSLIQVAIGKVCHFRGFLVTITRAIVKQAYYGSYMLCYIITKQIFIYWWTICMGYSYKLMLQENICMVSKSW